MESCCDDCGLVYGSPGWIEAVVPDDIWLLISPSHDEGGLLCINCISRRCVEAGLENVPVRFAGNEPLVPVEAFPREVRCNLCGHLDHITTPNLSGLEALGWHYVELTGWVCPKHNDQINGGTKPQEGTKVENRESERTWHTIDLTEYGLTSPITWTTPSLLPRDTDVTYFVKCEDGTQWIVDVDLDPMQVPSIRVRQMLVPTIASAEAAKPNGTGARPTLYGVPIVEVEPGSLSSDSASIVLNGRWAGQPIEAKVEERHPWHWTADELKAIGITSPVVAWVADPEEDPSYQAYYLLTESDQVYRVRRGTGMIGPVLIPTAGKLPPREVAEAFYKALEIRAADQSNPHSKPVAIDERFNDDAFQQAVEAIVYRCLNRVLHSVEPGPDSAGDGREAAVTDVFETHVRRIVRAVVTRAMED